MSGALTGLAADLAAGGLTLGAGMLAGALLGALGGAGVARGMQRRARPAPTTRMRWDDAFLDALVADALLRYLAVAHYGRGRGEWQASEAPPRWREQVESMTSSTQSASCSGVGAARVARQRLRTFQADLAAQSSTRASPTRRARDANDRASLPARDGLLRPGAARSERWGSSPSRERLDALGDERRPAVDESGVELHERRAGVDLRLARRRPRGCRRRR